MALRPIAHHFLIHLGCEKKVHELIKIHDKYMMEKDYVLYLYVYNETCLTAQKLTEDSNLGY